MHAVVTGASSGIGRAIARRLAADGMELSLHARANASGLSEAAGMSGGGPTYLADLGTPGAGASLVDRVWQEKPIDVWVHNAGADILTGGDAQLPFDQKLDRLWRVDVRGTIESCRAVGERMAERGSGVILTMGWDQARTGMEGEAGQLFGATKGAIIAFTKSLARTLAPEVRVNCIAPGWICTKWGRHAPLAWRRRAEREALLNRWGEPGDVAEVAAFLASPAASFVTAEVIAVNGGFAGPASGQP